MIIKPKKYVNAKERASAAMQRHQDNGRRMGRIDMLPYGSKPDPEDDKLTVDDPYEQEIIKVAVKMKQQGCSCGVIAKKLNEVVIVPGMEINGVTTAFIMLSNGIDTFGSMSMISGRN